MNGCGTDDRRLARERAFQRLAEQATTPQSGGDDGRSIPSRGGDHGRRAASIQLAVALAVGAAIALAVLALGASIGASQAADPLADPDVEYHDSGGGGTIDREDPLVICFQRGEREDCVRQPT